MADTRRQSLSSVDGSDLKDLCFKLMLQALSNFWIQEEQFSSCIVSGLTLCQCNVVMDDFLRFLR